MSSRDSVQEEEEEVEAVERPEVENEDVVADDDDDDGLNRQLMGPQQQNNQQQQQQQRQYLALQDEAAWIRQYGLLGEPHYGDESYSNQLAAQQRVQQQQQYQDFIHQKIFHNSDNSSSKSDIDENDNDDNNNNNNDLTKLPIFRQQSKEKQAKLKEWKKEAWITIILISKTGTITYPLMPLALYCDTVYTWACSRPHFCGQEEEEEETLSTLSLVEYSHDTVQVLLKLLELLFLSDATTTTTTTTTTSCHTTTTTTTAPAPDKDATKTTTTTTNAQKTTTGTVVNRAIQMLQSSFSSSADTTTSTTKNDPAQQLQQKQTSQLDLIETCRLAHYLQCCVLLDEILVPILIQSLDKHNCASLYQLADQLQLPSLAEASLKLIILKQQEQHEQQKHKISQSLQKDVLEQQDIWNELLTPELQEQILLIQQLLQHHNRQQVWFHSFTEYLAMLAEQVDYYKERLAQAMQQQQQHTNSRAWKYAQTKIDLQKQRVQTLQRILDKQKKLFRDKGYH